MEGGKRTSYCAVLNDDVLLEIFLYLDGSDILRMQQVSPQFLRVSERALKRLQSLDLDQIFQDHGITADSYTIKMIVLKASNSIRRIKVSRSSFKNFIHKKKIDDENVLFILTKCLNLEHIHFQEIDLLTNYLDPLNMLAPRLKSFRIGQCVVADGMKSVLSRASQLVTLSLTDLTDTNYVRNPRTLIGAIIGSVPNLRELTIWCDNHSSTMSLLECLTFRDTLVYLDITMERCHDPVNFSSRRMWHYIREFTKLEYLRVSIRGDIINGDLARLSCKETLKKLQIIVGHSHLTSPCITKFVKECKLLRFFEHETNVSYKNIILTDLFHQDFSSG